MDAQEKDKNFDSLYDVDDTVLGRGRYSIVRRCTDRLSGKSFAAKFIKKGTGYRDRTEENVAREVSILRELNGCEQIIALRQVFQTDRQAILVLELAEGQELFQYILDRGCVPESEASRIVRQLLLAVKHMHDRNIAHLDLKPENIVLEHRAKGAEDELRLKLVDFGLSKKLVAGTTVFAMLGTAEFFAPEQVNYDPVSVATDMWAVGVITYNLLSGASPFLGESKQETMCNISAAAYAFDDEYFAGASEAAKEFVARLLMKNPRERLTVDQCLQHRWIRGAAGMSLKQNKTESTLPSPVPLLLAKKEETEAESEMEGDQGETTALQRNTFDVSSRETTVDEAVSYYIESEADDDDVPSSIKIMSYSASCSGTLSIFIGQDHVWLRAQSKKVLFDEWSTGHFRMVDELLTAGVNLDLDGMMVAGQTLAHVASATGQLQLIEYLQSRNADLNVTNRYGDSTLHVAARNGHLPVVRYLLSRNTELNSKNAAGKTPVLLAASKGHLQIVQLLLSCSRLDPSVQDNAGNNLLHVACQHGYTSLVEQLCTKKIGLNIRNKAGRTALHLAAMNGHFRCAITLICRGCWLNVRSKDHKSALYLALEHHHLDIALMLVNRVDSLNGRDRDGETALHVAAREGVLPVVFALLESGADPTVTSNRLMTPLHLAAAGGNAFIVKALCYHGADIKVKNAEGRTARGVARFHYRQDIVQLLTDVSNEQTDGVDSTRPPSSSCCPQLDTVRVNVFGMTAVGKTALIEALGADEPTHSSAQKERFSSGPALAEQRDHTKCIQVRNVQVAGCGNVCFWEFSGAQSHYCLYDLFLRECADCLQIIVFRALDPVETQLHDIRFWLTFLQSCVRPTTRPSSEETVHQPTSLSVIFVGTYVDHSGGQGCVQPDTRNSSRSSSPLPICDIIKKTSSKLSSEFQHDSDSLVFVNMCPSNSPGLQLLRKLLADYCKQALCQRGPSQVCSGGEKGYLFQASIDYINYLRRSTSLFPVIPKKQLVHLLRKNINPVPKKDHRWDQLMQLLQYSGRIVIVRCDHIYDMVVLSPSWLFSDILGQLLTPKTRLCHGSHAGVVNDHHMRRLFPHVPDVQQLMLLLQALNLCAYVQDNGHHYHHGCRQLKYEFPALFGLTAEATPQQQQELGQCRFLYSPRHPQIPNHRVDVCICLNVHLRLKNATKDPHGDEDSDSQAIVYIFPRVQVNLRRWVNDRCYLQPDLRLSQWAGRSRLARGQMESVVSVTVRSAPRPFISLELRGTMQLWSQVASLLRSVGDVIESTFLEAAPGFRFQEKIAFCSNQPHLANRAMGAGL